MYVTDEEVRAAAIGMPEDVIDSTDLDAIIVRAARMFDRATGVTDGYFEAVASGATASARTFYGNGLNYLKLDPYVAGSLNTTLSYPSESYAALDFVERDGYLVRSSDIGVLAVYPPSTGWYSGVPISVTAIWGYSATPDDVKQAVIELTINLWRETDPSNLKLVGLDGQPLRETLPPRVAWIAKKYRMGQGVMV